MNQDPVVRTRRIRSDARVVALPTVPKRSYVRQQPSRSAGFILRLADGTCVKVMAGCIEDIWIVGERPSPAGKLSENKWVPLGHGPS